MEEQKTMARDLTQGSVLRQLLVFSLPMVLANLLQTAYNMVDGVIVGHFVGAAGLSAVTTCGDVISFYTFMCMGACAGGQIIIGQRVGRRDAAGVSRAIGTLFTSMLALAVAVTVFCLLTPRWQAGLVNLPPEALDYGLRYFITCSAGTVFVFGYNAVSSVLRAMGDSRRPLVFVAIASAANLVLDLLFVVGFGWDTLGAALATVLGQGFSFVVSLAYLYKHRESFGFDFRLRSFFPKASEFRLLVKLGGPLAVQYGAIMLSMLYVVSLINAFGVAASTVNGVAMRLENICRVVTNSMSTAGTAMIAQCVGAGKLERCKSTVRCGLSISFVYCGLCGLCIGLFPRQVFSVFTTDPAVLDYAQQYALVGVGICLGHALRNPFMMVANGVGNAVFALVVGLLDSVVARIALSVLLGVTLGHGLLGFWWGSCLAGFVPAILGAGYYFSGRWKTFRIGKTKKSALSGEEAIENVSNET